ncbi:hypothetical protein [uncultured Alistipes sp.]|uniref:hypothetical protein n=1 Tax=uncultured Alistipes sp. TaxID=538949 RepID=UPI002729EC17|nr:hypothetical protein [uncultured Alistipes sp.]
MMTNKNWNRLYDVFHDYWIENNNNGAWPKHSTTLTGSWRALVDDDPNPAWTDKEARLRINGLRTLTVRAAMYNDKMARAMGQNYITTRGLTA